MNLPALAIEKKTVTYFVMFLLLGAAFSVTSSSVSLKIPTLQLKPRW